MESYAKNCWNYQKSNGQEAPALGLVVCGPLGSLPFEGEDLLRIDTGYEGFLLLDEEKYKHIGLHLSELPRKYWSEGETVTGEIFRLRRSLALVRILMAGVKLEGYIDTFRGNTEDLMGLSLIRTLRLLLDGPAQRACLI